MAPRRLQRPPRNHDDRRRKIHFRQKTTQHSRHAQIRARKRKRHFSRRLRPQENLPIQRLQVHGRRLLRERGQSRPVHYAEPDESCIRFQ